MCEIRRKAFIEAYLSNGGNATQAAITAGYSEKTARQKGQQLLTLVDIRTEVDKRHAVIIEAIEAKTLITKEALIEMMLTEAKGEKLIAKPVVSASGDVVYVDKPDTNAPARIKAITSLGQELFDAFKEKKEVDIKTTIEKFIKALEVLPIEQRIQVLDAWDQL